MGKEAGIPQKQKHRGIRRLRYALLIAAALAPAGIGGCAIKDGTTVPGVDKTGQVVPGENFYLTPEYGAECIVYAGNNLSINGKLIRAQVPTIAEIEPGKPHELTTTTPLGIPCISYGGLLHPADDSGTTFINRSREQALQEALAGIGPSAQIIEIR